MRIGFFFGGDTVFAMIVKRKHFEIIGSEIEVGVLGINILLFKKIKIKKQSKIW